jgi:hypothetical protein
MKIINTLNNEALSSTEKLEAVKNLVATVRAKYGNTDKNIQPAKVYTTDGYVPINLLGNAERVAVATQELKEAITMATAGAEDTEGAVFDRIFEAVVAVNPILVNLDMESDSSY